MIFTTTQELNRNWFCNEASVEYMLKAEYMPKALSSNQHLKTKVSLSILEEKRV